MNTETRDKWIATVHKWWTIDKKRTKDKRTFPEYYAAQIARGSSFLTKIPDSYKKAWDKGLEEAKEWLKRYEEKQQQGTK